MINGESMERRRKRLVLLATDRYSINVNDFYMFFRRTEHDIVALVYERGCPEKSWWRRGEFPDPARGGLLDPLDLKALKLFEWKSIEELMAILADLEFDYVCVGNGSAPAHQAVLEYFGRERVLFSEYGWLPWSEHFYIAKDGCGFDSDVAKLSAADVTNMPVDELGIKNLQRSFDCGHRVLDEGFVYVPLQKDVNDFKFNFCEFDSNIEFLEFVNRIVPKDIKILVKEHPLYRQNHDYERLGGGRMYDISDKRYSKAGLLQRMVAMVCINSTSILEALAFGRRVFAYGADIYCNKDVVHYRIEDAERFGELLQWPRIGNRGKQFVSILLSRQVNRKRCLKDDAEYIASHYWNRNI